MAFALGSAPVLIHLLLTGRLPVLVGIELDGGGLIEQAIGRGPLPLLIVLHMVESSAEVLAARWLWQSRRRGGILAAALLPAGLFFGVGLALPLPILLAPVKAVLLLSGWRSLRR